MFCLVMLLLLCLGHSQSLEFKSIGNATIPTVVGIETVEGISFDKRSKDSNGMINLPFVLLNITSYLEKVELTINNNKQAVEIYYINIDPPLGVKVYIQKEVVNNSILYKIKFFKMDYAKTGVYNLCIDKYLCAKSFIFSSPIATKFTKPKLGLEGDPIRITCLYEAYPEVTEILWSRIEGNNLTTANITKLYSDDHTKLLPSKESNITNATLFIEKLIKEDTGIYMCTVISDRGSDSSILKINVKGRWAALYPFIGIVIEVIILVVAILVYERYQIRSQNRKNKHYIDNADDDNKDNDIPLAGGGDDDNNVAPAENGCPAVEIEGEKLNNLEVRQREATTRNV